MTIKYFQKGFNFSQDGPGNRLVIHFQGCNLKCPWCSNPEGLKVGGTYSENGKLSYTEVEVSDLVKECIDCEMMFFDGGGVTVTGGEATLQFDALKMFFTQLRANGINTALECNATHPRLPELFELCDFLILDCKHYDSQKHFEVCGVDNKIIINNIALAAKERSQLLVRIPLIGGFNSSVADAEGFAKLFNEIATSACSFEFLTYHEFGKDKYAKLGMAYTVENAFVSDGDLAAFKEIFKKNSLKIIYT